MYLHTQQNTALGSVQFNKVGSHVHNNLTHTAL